MLIPIHRIRRHILLATLLATVCFTQPGCEFVAESTFTLANDSRLPKWVSLPPGFTRANTSLTMSYHSLPWGGTARFILRNEKGEILNKEDGRLRCRKPFQLKTPRPGFPAGYPGYEPITANGITEIIEHRKMEPKFYVTDDETVWKQYRSMGCD